MATPKPPTSCFRWLIRSVDAVGGLLQEEADQFIGRLKDGHTDFATKKLGQKAL